MSDTDTINNTPQFNKVYPMDSGLQQMRVHEQSIQVTRGIDGKVCLYIGDGDSSFMMKLSCSDVEHLVALLQNGAL